MANEFIARKGLIVSGSTRITGSLDVSTGITGSLFGTASYASNADLLDGLNSTVFATTGSNTFTGNQIIAGTIDTQTAGITGSATIYNDGTVSSYLYFSNTPTQVFPAYESYIGVQSNGVFTIRGAALLSLYTSGARRWDIGTDGILQPATADTYDIGTPVNRVKNVYLSGFVSASSYTSSISNAIGFVGTASFAQNAATASLLLGSVVSASYAQTASVAKAFEVISGSVNPNATQYTGSFTGSFTGSITSASYALTASYVAGAASTWDDIANKPDGILSSSTQINTLSGVSASFATIAVTSSYPFFVTGSDVAGNSQTTYTNFGQTNFSTTGSFIVGRLAGNNASSSGHNIFIGERAGQNAHNTADLIALGRTAGENANGATNGIFLGYRAGINAVNGAWNVFLGDSAGESVRSFGSIAIGRDALFSGSSATSTVAIGYRAGRRVTGLSSIGSYNIIIGANVSVAANASRQINIGGVIFGTGSNNDVNSGPISSSIVGARVGIAEVNPINTLQVGGNVSASSYTSSLDNQVGFLGTASWAQNATTASYALTGGSGGGGVSDFPYTGSAIISGSLIVTGSSTVRDNFTVNGGSLFVDATNNRVGINTTVPTHALTVTGSANITGSLDVTGAFTAQTKSFKILHQTQPGKHLIYGVLEGPEHAIYARGRLKNDTIIQLPEEWSWLVDMDSITVHLTPIGKHQKLYVDGVYGTKIVIGYDHFFPTEVDCFYTVIGTRKDIAPLQTVE